MSETIVRLSQARNAHLDSSSNLPKYISDVRLASPTCMGRPQACAIHRTGRLCPVPSSKPPPTGHPQSPESPPSSSAMIWMKSYATRDGKPPLPSRSSEKCPHHLISSLIASRSSSVRLDAVDVSLITSLGACSISALSSRSCFSRCCLVTARFSGLLRTRFASQRFDG